MQINFKHVAATAMAVAMSLSLAVPAFAAGNGGNRTLTVKGDTLDNKKVYAVQMFDARLTESAGSNTFDSYELADAWLSFFQNDTYGIGKAAINAKLENDGDPDNDGLVLGGTPTNEQWENAILAYMEAQEKDGEDLIDLANKAQAWVRSHDGQPSETESTEFANKIITATANNDIAQFTDLKPGYYLVYPEGGSTGTASRGTDAMLVNVPRDEGEATLNIKSTYPTVEKKVDDGNTATGAGNADNGSAQVGEVVTFTLTSAVPDMSDYDTFVFQFTDKLPAGLTLVNDDNSVVTKNEEFTTEDITLTIDGNNVDMTGDKVTVNVTDGEDADEGKKILTVTINNLLAEGLLTDGSMTAGDPIVLTYKAMVNENAVVGNDPVTNEAKVEYSNDPDSNSMGSSTPDTSTVYTYDINVNKWAEDIVGQIDGNLAGAQFQLTRDEAGKEVVKLMGNGIDAYRVAKPDEAGAVDSFTTTSTGDINIAGLEAGTYYLHEIAAPTGYNKLKDPITIVITMDNHPNPGDATITVDGKGATSDDGTTVNVENKKGVELPETGSIGTIGLTVAGVAIVLLGVFAPRKKKKSNQE